MADPDVATAILNAHFENTSRSRDDTRANDSPTPLETPEGNSQLGSNCPNSKAPENSSVVVPLMADPDIVNAILNPRKNAEFAIADDLVPPLLMGNWSGSLQRELLIRWGIVN